MSKADYVRAQGQNRTHSCHWPGCQKQVPPAMWGCSRHWFALPASLRVKIWRHYRPGQENDLNPNVEYIDVAKQVQGWIAKQGEDTADV